MRSTAARALLGTALTIAAIVLFVVLRDGGGDGSAGSYGGGGATAAETRASEERDEGRRGDDGGRPSEPATPVVSVRDGQPVGGVAELEFAAGDRIRFRVESDVADEIHVHGYDVSEEVEAGGTARFDFPATIEGVFEVELEGRGEQIAELRVNP